jgi:hypothetical protein
VTVSDQSSHANTSSLMADTRVIRKQNKLWVEKMDRVCVCVCVCVCRKTVCVVDSEYL